MKDQKLKKWISELTLEEKAGLCSGQDFWHTKEIGRLGIPAYRVSDGPGGLRKQIAEGDHMGAAPSVPAVCFPAGCAVASSFDRELARHVGEILGEECQAEDIAILLGPSVNIKRSPLGGRSFEYYSEDPFLTSEIAAAMVQGIQSRHVGACVKHFLANNQETCRMSVSAEVDERTLNEIYLPAFEACVKKGHAWSVMSSYNRVNGVYAAESRLYLTEYLREKWGFEGCVISDWGGVNARVADLKAGLDLEMPSSDGKNDWLIAEAVRDGLLDEAVLDQAVYRILSVFEKYGRNRDTKAVFDMERDHQASKLAEDECAVLLKNEDILPLKKEQKIAVIGEFALHPRFQGGGSANVNAHRVTGAYEILKSYVDDIRFAKGFSDEEEQKQEWTKEALECAAWADAAVIFAGLPEAYESEGMDRTHMRLPRHQDQLIGEVLRIQPNTVVVLHNGSPVEMPWAGGVKGILEMYLGGEAVGESAADILMGKVNPSGRLSETFPLRLEDTPSYLNFPGETDRVFYREGIFVGYRYYDKKKLPVLFPFGHGLSYTKFTYSNLRVSAREMDVPEQLKVTADITNTGTCPGKEVVQLYVSDSESSVIRPEKELKGFEKIYLEPGETKTVSFSLDARGLAFYSEKIHDWYVEEGGYQIMVAGSSADIRLQTEVMVRNPEKLPVEITLDTTFQELFEYPEVMEAVRPLRDLLAERFQKKVDSDQGNEKAMRTMLGGMPLRGALSFNHSDITVAQAEKMVQKANEIMRTKKNGE